MPEELRNTTSPNTKNPKAMEKKYGAKDWYDWALKHWGVKWDIITDCAESQPTELLYCFDSPWGPPEAFMHTLAKLYPKFYFCLEYSEPGMCFSGTMEFENGECINNEELQDVWPEQKEDWEDQ